MLRTNTASQLTKNFRISALIFVVLVALITILGKGGGDGGDGGGDSGNGQEDPPPPLDEASRLVAVNEDLQTLQCECAVQSGAYSSIAECKAELFKLEPTGDTQCLREVISASPLEVPGLACNLTALEDLAGCLATASCDEDVAAMCGRDLDQQLMACPDTPRDSVGIDLSNNVDVSGCSGPGVKVNLPGAEVFFDEDKFNFHNSSAFTPPPTWTNSEVLSLVGDTLTTTSEALTSEYDLDVTSFTVGTPPPLEPDDRFIYAVTGTLADVLGGDLACFDGARLDINLEIDRTRPADFTDTTLKSITTKRWETEANYSITNRPNSAADVTVTTPTQLFASDSFVEEALDVCLNHPGDQLAALYDESLDATYDELCRCAPDEASRDQCLQAKQSPRLDCLAQLVDLSPAAAEMTECLIEDMDIAANELPELACCTDPNDIDCLSGNANQNAITSLSGNLCGASTEITDAVLSCMGPPPLAPVDFSDDPARCTPTQDMLASGLVGDVMVVSHSQKLNPDTMLPFSRHYIILDLEQLDPLKSIPLDIIQQSLFSLYLLDAGGSKDQCELPGIVSIAFDRAPMSPIPDFGSINAQISAIQTALGLLPGRIQEGQEQAEAAARELYYDLICGAVADSMQDIAFVDFKRYPITSFFLNIAFKQSLLAAIGCSALN